MGSITCFLLVSINQPKESFSPSHFSTSLYMTCSQAFSCDRKYVHKIYTNMLERSNLESKFMQMCRVQIYYFMYQTCEINHVNPARGSRKKIF